MEIRMLAPIALGFVGLLLLAVAQIWFERRARLVATGIATVAIFAGTWDFKDLERRWDNASILRDAGQVFFFFGTKHARWGEFGRDPGLSQIHRFRQSASSQSLPVERTSG